jgi:hypothetical protein
MLNDTFDNGQGSITFSKRNKLIDGQCRILASLDAEYPLRQIVFAGASSDVQFVKNTGKPRNVTQLIQKKGYKHARILALVAKQIANMQLVPDGKDGIIEKCRKAITTQDIMQTIEDHPDICVSVEKIVPKQNHFPISAISHLVLLDYLCRLDGSPKKADEFLDILSNEISAKHNNPVKKLRIKLEGLLRRDKMGIIKADQAKLLILVYNMFRIYDVCNRLHVPKEIPRLLTNNS